jgi:DHA2 family lincomycin resistance protein-like MFS transporter
VQQLAGAAGTALFITVLTIASTASTQKSATYALEASALDAGTHAAFLCGAIISTLALIPAAMIQRPASAEDMGRELQP